jgi:hypothetical protein
MRMCFQSQSLTTLIGKIKCMNWPLEDSDYHWHYALGVVSRMMSVCYKLSLNESEVWLKDALQNIDTKYVSGDDLLVAFIQHLVTRVRQEACPISMFILLVDDTVQNANGDSRRMIPHGH